MKSSVNQSWIRQTRANTHARLRLFCFAHSGGGASFFRNWGESIGTDIDVYSLQLPGRENRRSEPPFTQFTPLIETLADVLLPYMDLPFAFFGHSLGALISFELARQLRRQGRRGPAQLFVSGRRAPHIPRLETSIVSLPDSEFIAEIQRFHGTAPEVLQNKEVMELFLPLLRADFSLYESFVYASERALHCPISVFGGDDDTEVSLENLMAWKVHTSSMFKLHIFPGDHFFLRKAEVQILQIINRDVAFFLDF